MNSQHEVLKSLRDEQLKRNLIVAIQDVIKIHQLDHVVDISYAPCLTCLMDYNYVSHYILWKRNQKSRDDHDHIKNYKMKLLFQMLEDKNMQKHIETIEDDCGVGLIDEIKKHLINFIDDKKHEPTENEKQKILDYWKCLKYYKSSAL